MNLSLTFHAFRRTFVALAVTAIAASTATPCLAEQATAEAGEWTTLFDGTSTDAWREYNKEAVTSGWKVANGELTCISKKDQGDGARNENIITKEKFGAFELVLEFKVTPGANSGVMFHVKETKKQPYHTGPEIQIQDHAGGHDPQKCGWLYQLYSCETDAVKPVGEWNELRITITPEKCQHFVNGVLYADYVKGSEDWKKRVAASKFGKWEGFGEETSGHICLQDHNDEVSYRNIKVRPL